MAGAGIVACWLVACSGTGSESSFSFNSETTVASTSAGSDASSSSGDVAAPGVAETSTGSTAADAPSTGVPVADEPSSVGLTAARFPVAVSEARDHLVDGSGAPWMMFGDSAWSLIAQLDQAEAETYLDNRQAKGFNLVLVSLLEATFSSDPPNNSAGVAPFTGTAFQSPINEQYFQHSDEVIRAAADRGITVLLTPAYLGYDDSEGWGAEVRAASDEQLAEYGATVGARYASAPNIIWLMGGDRKLTDDDDDQKTMLSRTNALATGIRSADPNHLMTFHTGPDQRAGEVVGDLPWLDLDNVYSYAGKPVEMTRAALEDEPQRPIFWMEGHYENNPDIELVMIRAQAWGSILSGALGGHIFGNDPIWHFGSGGVFGEVPVTWEEAIDGEGSTDMSHMIELLSGVEWSRLRTDTDGAFMSAPDSSVASVSADVGLAYVPTDDSVTVDLSVFTPGSMRIRWYDPTSAEFQVVGDFDTIGPMEVSHPGDNSRGDSDWVLVVDAP